MASASRSVGVVLFEDFELLDVFGPVALLSQFPEEFPITYLARQAGPVCSNQGAQVIATESLESHPSCDVMLVPGGMGTRALVNDHEFLTMLAQWAAHASILASVCTGSVLLAAAGLLEGYRATSNKRAFAWVVQHGNNVTWEPRARWVEDRKRWTSSGVAAGMDMAAALIAHLHGADAAREAARRIELVIHPDPTWDPFAADYGHTTPTF